MSLSRRQFMINTAAAAACALLLSGRRSEAENTESGRTDPYQPSWDSLQNYQCPDWFRDAKFGIWAHWTAQSVPGMGDWYASYMYEQGNADYDYQCQHYGHPSKVGFKDIDHIWHAENWDPEKMIALYKAAGAKYFVALAQHHDNFDCFDSKWQPWNSVAIGPKKDIVGDVTRVTLLGSPSPLQWQRTGDGLVVTLPDQKPCDHAFALKIEGLDLAASNPAQAPLVPIVANSNGQIVLDPADSLLHGTEGYGCMQFSIELRPTPLPHVDKWTTATDSVSWLVHFDQPGTYKVSVTASAGDGPSAITIGPDAIASTPINVLKTSSFDDYQPFIGEVNITLAGDQELFVKASNPTTWKQVNLSTITLHNRS